MTDHGDTSDDTTTDGTPAEKPGRHHVAGQNIVITAGRITGLPIADMAIIDGVLVPIGRHASSCTICGRPVAVILTNPFFLEPLCAVHRPHEKRMTFLERERRIEAMQHEGRGGGTILAFALWSLDRLQHGPASDPDNT